MQINRPVSNFLDNLYDHICRKNNTEFLEGMRKRFCSCNAKAPFTRYNLLSNRYDNRLYRVYSRLSNRIDNRLNEHWLFVQHGCQTGLATGCIV